MASVCFYFMSMLMIGDVGAVFDCVEVIYSPHCNLLSGNISKFLLIDAWIEVVCRL